MQKKVVDGKEVPCDGELYYRGINIVDLTNGFLKEQRFGFEEAAYLLLFGKLPNKEQWKEFSEILANQRDLPTNFVRDVIMKAPSQDMMNTLSRSVLTLYSYDENPGRHFFTKCITSMYQFNQRFPNAVCIRISGT